MSPINYLLLTFALVSLFEIARSATCPSATTTLTATATQQTLSSSNYPSSYPHNEDCKWLISTTSSSKEVYVHLTFLSIERYFDFLSLYDSQTNSGTRLFYSETMTAPSSLVSSGQNMYIAMTTDYSVAYTGFTLDFIAVPSSSPSCGSSLTATSTDGELFYRGSSSCSYTITAASSSDVITITVPQRHSSVTVVFSGGSTTITTESSHGVTFYYNTVTVQLTQAALVLYKSVSSTLTTTTTVAPVTTAVTSSEVFICSGNGQTASQVTTNYIVSPNYPSSYNSNANCYMTITASPTTAAVMLQALDIEIDPNDGLDVYDGPSTSFSYLGRFFSIGDTFNSTGSSLTLFFYTGSYSNLRGFKISYRTSSTDRTVPSCASSYTLYSATTSEQFLSSMNYPSNYPNSHNEYWLIQKPSESDIIVIDFRTFRVESAVNCIYDVVKVYDGPCTTDIELAAFCGYSTHVIEDSSGQYILITFSTDGSIIYSGFYMAYYIGAYTAASTGASTDDDGTNMLPGIIGGVIGGVFFLALVITIVFMVNKSNRRVSHATNVKQSVAPKKTTTSDMLRDMQRRAGEERQREKVPRKYKPSPPNQPGFHVQPNPPGANTAIFNMSQYNVDPHPAPNPVGPMPMYPPPPGPNLSGYDPAYPPTVGPQMNPSLIPSPFTYVTPSAAISGTQYPGHV